MDSERCLFSMCPAFFVEKTDGTLRPCMDYGLLNNITVPDPYPTPLEPQIA